MKKYELTTETIQFAGRTLHRIKAVKDFGSVKAGSFGGWIENEKNLSQDDNAWIYGEAMVFDNAKVFDNANIFGNAKVFDNARVYDKANVYSNAVIKDNVKVHDAAEVFGNAIVCGYAEVYDDAKVYDNAWVYGYAKVYDKANVYNNAYVLEYAEAYGNVRIYGKATIKGDAKVHDAADYIVFKNFWSSERYFTWTRSNNKWSVGCFHGTGEELIKKAYADSDTSGREYERVVRYVQSILADERK